MFCKIFIRPKAQKNLLKNSSYSKSYSSCTSLLPPKVWKFCAIYQLLVLSSDVVENNPLFVSQECNSRNLKTIEVISSTPLFWLDVWAAPTRLRTFCLIVSRQKLIEIQTNDIVPPLTTIVHHGLIWFPVENLICVAVYIC